MMLIGEVARRAGVTPRALRYYEEQGLLRAGRDRNGYRVYDDGAVVLVRNIARLLRAGLSSEDVLEFRDCLGDEHPGPPQGCTGVTEVYEGRLEMLDRRIETLTELRGRLDAELGRIRAARPGTRA